MRMTRRASRLVASVGLVLLVWTGGALAYHSTDYDTPDWTISLSELLRAIQFYNVGDYCCSVEGEDGFAAGVGDQTCLPHSADYDLQDWKIDLSELLRIIQFYNTGSYHVDPDGEDGFAPGVDPTPSNLTVTSLEVLNDAPQVGHPLKLRVGVESLEEVEGVPIYFFMAAKLLGEPEDYEPEQFLVGSHTIARVVPGRQDFIVDLPIATRVYEGEELPALSDGATVVEPVAEEFPRSGLERTSCLRRSTRPTSSKRSTRMTTCSSTKVSWISLTTSAPSRMSCWKS